MSDMEPRLREVRVDDVVVRPRRRGDAAAVAFRLEPATAEGLGAVLITREQAQEIVDGLAALGVVPHG